MQYVSSFFSYQVPRVYKRYGWKRDLPDRRDHRFQITERYTSEKVDLRDKCPGVYDQGQLGSCTANAIACAIQFDEMKQHLSSQTVPSRLFVYYNERDMEGSVDQDSGASLRDGVKSINKVGYCNEVDWPYDISQFTVKPSEKCYEYAKSHKSLSYRRVSQNESDIKTVLDMGFPVVFGISVYESFESDKVAKTGVVPMPGDNERM